MSASRIHSWVAALALLLSIAILAPARSAFAVEVKPAAKPVKLKKNQAWVAPDFAKYGVRVIAFAPVSSVDRNPESEKLVRQGLEPGFATLKYRFLSQATTMDLARRAQAGTTVEALVKAHLAGQPLDTTATHAVGRALNADALLMSHVTQWQRFVVDPSARGQSFTQIGVDLAFYSLKDGALLWRGSFFEKGDGPYNDPAAYEGQSRDPGGNAIGRRGQLEPPLFVDVLEKLSERVVKSLPPPPAAP